MKYFYVKRYVEGVEQELLVSDWHYKAWVGCYCLIKDREFWI